MKVLVLGAGFGGLELTAALSEALGDEVEVTLVDVTAQQGDRALAGARQFYDRAVEKNRMTAEAAEEAAATPDAAAGPAG